MIKFPSYEDLQFQSLEALSEYTGVAARDNGPMTTAVLAAVNNSMATALRSVEQRLWAMNISKAGGYDLDVLAAGYGLQRNAAQLAMDNTRTNVLLSATGSLTAADLRALISDPNYPTILDNGVVFLAGLELSTTDGKKYIVTEDAVFVGSATSVGVRVIAVAPGEGGNTGAGTITVHNVGSAQPELAEIEGYVTVANARSITGGSNVEGDLSLRYRVSRVMDTLASGNVAAIETAALSVPGIRSVTIRDQYTGIGTLDVLLRGTGTVITADIMEATRAAISRVKPIGTVITISRPVYAGIEFEVFIALRPGTATIVHESIKSAVTWTLVDLINNYPMGRKFVLSDVIAAARNTDHRIIDAYVANLTYGHYSPELGSITTPIVTMPHNIDIAAEEQWVTSTEMITTCVANAR